MSSRYELSISTDYVPDWTLTDAIRELFQNAKDQEVTQPDNEMYFYYDNVHLLQIGNKKSVLTVRSLLLGSSSKRDDPNTIGQFGEGYKVAALVLTRLGKKLMIYNYGAREVWTFKFIESKRFGTRILVVDINKSFFWNKPPNNDLIITVDNIEPGEYTAIMDTNLHIRPPEEILTTTYGRILLDQEFKGRIFVNGLFVCDTECTHGYDLKPQYIKLNRDRKAVGDWDLTYLTGRMWVETGSSLIENLARANAKDVEGIVYHMQTTPGFAVSARSNFEQEHGKKAHPVTSQEEAAVAKKAGMKPIIVSQSYKKIIDSGHTVDTVYSKRRRANAKAPVVLTLPQRFEKWYRKYKSDLDVDAQIHFRELLADLKKEKQK